MSINYKSFIARADFKCENIHCSRPCRVIKKSEIYVIAGIPGKSLCWQCADNERRAEKEQGKVKNDKP